MTASDVATRRVNSSMLQESVGRTVRLVGKCLQNDGNTLLLETGDRGQVQVKRPHMTMAGGMMMQQPQQQQQLLTDYVEVCGQVERDLTITEYQLINFGQQFDLQLYDRLIQLSLHNPQLF